MMAKEEALVEGRTIPADILRRFVAEVFRKAGVREPQIDDATDVLLYASLHGIDTHGVRNLKALYIDRILDGQVSLDADLRIEQETSSTARCDGESGLGLAISCDAMRLAMAKAEATGIGIVNVRNTHHLGAAGYFAKMALEHGQLGVCLTGEFFGGGGEGIGIAPINSHRPLFSSNPISLAAPCSRHSPYVFDMSTTVVPINRVERYGQMGQSIPLGWAKDSLGQPTSDPAAVQVMEPLGGLSELGGHKGVGLAMLVSIVSAVLSGAWAESEADDGTRKYRQTTKAHFFAAVRVDQFMPLEDFRAAMDALIDEILNVPRENADEPIYYPGLKEAQTFEQRSRDGIPLIGPELEVLESLAEQFNVELSQ